MFAKSFLFESEKKNEKKITTDRYFEMRVFYYVRLKL